MVLLTTQQSITVKLTIIDQVHFQPTIRPRLMTGRWLNKPKLDCAVFYVPNKPKLLVK